MRLRLLLLPLKSSAHPAASLALANTATDAPPATVAAAAPPPSLLLLLLLVLLFMLLLLLLILLLLLLLSISFLFVAQYIVSSVSSHQPQPLFQSPVQGGYFFLLTSAKKRKKKSGRYTTHLIY